MMCYQDRTFCPFSYECRDGAECPSAMTEDIEFKAQTAGYLICRFIEKPKCFFFKIKIGDFNKKAPDISK